MHLCISAFLAWARPSLGLLSGEGKNIEYTLLHSDSVLSTFLLLASFLTFPLTACRSIKLQEPFAPGYLSAEAVFHIYTDLPDPLLVPSHGERGTVGDSMLSLL